MMIFVMTSIFTLSVTVLSGVTADLYRKNNICNHKVDLTTPICGKYPLSPRYAYDKATNSCVMFIPERCGSKNDNNFRTRKERFEKCLKSSACLRPKKLIIPGIGKYYSYDTRIDSCKRVLSIWYTKFWPNDNIFKKLSECQNECTPHYKYRGNF
uniref:Putative bilaris n=1 Tax=Rhipicephalus pulchellus TaxID=72859 RepID=L7LSV4_RHIPC